MNTLLNKQCRDYAKHEAAMNTKQIEQRLIETPLWQFCALEQALHRLFSFKNYPQTIAFVNQIAQIAEAQNHHPELIVNYNRCKVSYNTHTVNGVTENDFICAAQIDQLYDQ